MKPRITVITLGVDDRERPVRFYGGLGLQTQGIIGTESTHGTVAFFDLQADLKLALWPRPIRSGAAKRATSRIRIITCRKWSGIRSSI
jgi:hypothetical protein